MYLFFLLPLYLNRSGTTLFIGYIYKLGLIHKIILGGKMLEQPYDIWWIKIEYEYIYIVGLIKFVFFCITIPMI